MAASLEYDPKLDGEVSRAISRWWQSIIAARTMCV